MKILGFILILVCVCLQCSESKNPASFPPCMYDKPLKDPVTGKTLDCWNNGIPDICPYSYECKYDAEGIYSVCCKKEYEYNPCIFGNPLQQKNSNMTVHCGFELGDEECPSSHVCKIDPVEAFTVCCPRPAVARTSSFTLKRISQTPSEPDIFCNSKIKCPYTHECIQLKSDHLNGYCKLRQKPRKMENINPCASGIPYSNSKSQEPIYCGRGKNHEDCPPPYECRIDPADSYAVCCPREEKFNPCHLKEPYMIENKSIYCGEGPRHTDCPMFYSCKTDPDGAYAVCCKDYLS